MIIDCISDLHGQYPKLEGGDLLIVAGDLTARDRPSEYNLFASWVKDQLYRKCIVIGGNHDNWIKENPSSIKTMQEIGDFEYLLDSGTEFEGLKIWGSPWTKTFKGMNPHCKAFTFDDEGELMKKFDKIPDDTDILITHSPPWTVLDIIKEPTRTRQDSPPWTVLDIIKKPTRTRQVGSTALMSHLLIRVKPKLHVFGHIHEGYGQEKLLDRTLFVNASHVNEHYEPVNKPVRVIL